MTVDGHGVLHRHLKQFLRAVGGQRNRAFHLARELATVDIKASHFIPPISQRILGRFPKKPDRQGSAIDHVLVDRALRVAAFFLANRNVP